MLIRIFKGIVGGFLFLAICGVWIGSSTAEPPALTKLTGAQKERVINLIAGAKKERELVGYSASWRPDVQEKMISQFREMYGLSDSDLKINIVSTRTGAVVTKITEELRAKVYKTDIAQTAPAFWFDELIAKKELMAYDCPEYKHFSPLVADPKVGPANPPYYISGSVSGWGIVYNPKYIKKEIAHWQDTLNPEYKGKICVQDAARSFSVMEAYLALRKVIGKKYFEELAKQQPFLEGSSSDTINKCITGEYPLDVVVAIELAFRANEKGAGLKIVLPTEGWAVVGYPTAIMAHAPHPNAAKLFIDYIHSEPCQDLFLNFAGNVSGRFGLKAKYDFPKPIFELKGVIPMDWSKVTKQDRDDAREEFRKLVREK